MSLGEPHFVNQEVCVCNTCQPHPFHLAGATLTSTPLWLIAPVKGADALALSEKAGEGSMNVSGV